MTSSLGKFISYLRPTEKNKVKYSYSRKYFFIIFLFCFFVTHFCIIFRDKEALYRVSLKGLYKYEDLVQFILVQKFIVSEILVIVIIFLNFFV